jgi:hypothetical protein
MPLNVHALYEAEGEYDEYREVLVGIVTDPKVAHNFLQAGLFDSNRISEIVTLNVLDNHYSEQIQQFGDPLTNPLCECGHYLMHHRRKGQGSCRHNTHKIYEGPKHKCKIFKLAEDPIILPGLEGADDYDPTND